MQTENYMTDNLIDTIAPVIEREAPETIPAPEIAALPEDKDVTLKQSRLNAILKDAQARAAKELRQRVTELETENANHKAIAAGSAPDADEVSRLKAEISAQKLENDSIKAASQRQARDTFITAQATKNQFIDTDVVVRLTAQNIRADGNGFTVLDDSGQPRTTATGEPLTPEAFYAEYATQRPYLVRGQVKSGCGGTSSGGAPVALTDRYTPEQLWGPHAVKDAGRILNAWSLGPDKRGYDAARRAAVQKGLLPR